MVIGLALVGAIWHDPALWTAGMAGFAFFGFLEVAKLIVRFVVSFNATLEVAELVIRFVAGVNGIFVREGI